MEEVAAAGNLMEVTITTVQNVMLGTRADAMDRSLGLLRILGIMNFILAAGYWAWTKNNILPTIIKQVLLISFFVYSIQNFTYVNKWVLDGFIEVASVASGVEVQKTAQNPLYVYDIGMKFIDPLVKKITVSKIGWRGQGLPELLALLLCTVFLFWAFLFMALTIFITMVEFYLLSGLSLFFLPFGVFQPTRFLAEKTFSLLISFGVKIMVLTFLVGICVPILSQISAGDSEQPLALGELLNVLAGVATMAALFMHAPGVAAGLMTGGPSMSGGGLLGGAMGSVGGALMGAAGGAAAMKAGGAAVKAAAGGGAAAVSEGMKALGKVAGGASMRPGAQSGTRLGKVGSFAAEGIGSTGRAAMAPVRAAGQMTKERLSQVKAGTIGAYSSAKQQAQTAAAAGGGGKAAGPRTGNLSLVAGKASGKAANMKKKPGAPSKGQGAQQNSKNNAAKTSGKAANMKKRPGGSQRRGVPEKKNGQGAGAQANSAASIKKGTQGGQGNQEKPGANNSSAAARRQSPGRLAKMTNAARARSSSGGSVEGAVAVSLNIRDEE